MNVFLFTGCFLQPVVKQKITDNITINKNWVEIHPKYPLKVSRQNQDISIEMPLSGWDFNLDGDSLITTTSGDLKIEVELIAENGLIFKLDEVGFG